jgi:hypothetical protein
VKVPSRETSGPGRIVIEATWRPWGSPSERTSPWWTNVTTHNPALRWVVGFKEETVLWRTTVCPITAGVGRAS